VNGTSSGSCPTAGFNITGVKPSRSTATDIIGFGIGIFRVGYHLQGTSSHKGWTD